MEDVCPSPIDTIICLVEIETERASDSTRNMKWPASLPVAFSLASTLLSFLPTTTAIGETQCVQLDHDANGNDSFIIADSEQGYVLPILTSSSDPAGVHIAVATFAKDVEKVTGQHPALYNDTLPDWASRAIVVGTAESSLVSGDGVAEVRGLWEAWDARVVNGVQGLEEALMVVGSDKVSLAGDGCPLARC